MAGHRHAISDLLDLLGRRWTLRVLWELRADPLTFGALRAACSDMSTSVLSERLAELREARLVEQAGGAYGLTPTGRELLTHLAPLNAFADRWRDG